jgi:hypothetical protein
MKESHNYAIANSSPFWAGLDASYAYDAFLIHCDRSVYDSIYGYDVTRCANSITSSTTVTATFHGDAGIEDNGGWLTCCRRLASVTCR